MVVPRARVFPEVAISEGASSSSSEEEDDDLVPSLEEEEVSLPSEKMPVQTELQGKKGKMVISLLRRCKVCHRYGHEAGFKGADYIDCPMKPCYLCKMPGHTTATCPHRPDIVLRVVPPRRKTGSSLDYVFLRQLKARIPPIKLGYVIPDKLCCAAMKYYSRRVTCLEFHPTKHNILLSADKKGHIGVLDVNKIHEKTVYSNIHTCIVSNIRFSPRNDCTIYAASSDGTVTCTDLETGIPNTLMNMNPNGWQGRNTWKMLYGMDVNPEINVLFAADCFGYLHSVDMRMNRRTQEQSLIHKKGSKVTGLHCNPVEPFYLLSCGNDHLARIWDIRRLQGGGSSICDLQHKGVVNSAYFSPISGNKIITTCQDNRIRVWDSIFSNMYSPSREIVHSHDFNRYITPFRAEWDPKDASESLAVVGRYISENYNGVALHPIDFIDVCTGQIVAEVIDPNIVTISSVNKLHPQNDLMATGSSRSLLIWRPKENEEHGQNKEEKTIIFCSSNPKKAKRSKFSDDDPASDDDDRNVKHSSKSKRKRKFSP